MKNNFPVILFFGILGAIVFLSVLMTQGKGTRAAELTDMEVSRLTTECIRPRELNPMNPPCLVMKDDGSILGLSVVPTAGNGVVSTFSRYGRHIDGIALRVYKEYPRGQHVFPRDHAWGKQLYAYQKGGQLSTASQ